MRYLIEAARNFGLDEIVDRALENENVHGIVVTIHDRWLNLMLAQVLKNLYPPFPVLYTFYRKLYEELNMYPGAVPLNLLESPPAWSEMFGKKSPIIVSLHLKPSVALIDPEEILGGNQSLFIQQENRDLPRVIANPQSPFSTMQGGISISNSGSMIAGTLGGIVEDKVSGKKFAVSCGHVINNNTSVVQPAQNDNGTNSIIGHCVYSKDAQLNQGNICNPRNPTSVLNDMDVALIELNQVCSQFTINNIGTVDGLMPAHLINKGLPIEYTGRTSSHRTNLVVNSIGVVQQVITLSGGICCYKDLVQIQDPYLSSLVQNSPAQSGDSGAWAMTHNSGRNEWCAMIVAEDRQSAYGIMSEDIITHLNSQTNLNLVCK